MADETYLDSVRDELIAQGVGRDPRVAGLLPPIWRHPRGGAPAPGSKQGTENNAEAMISLFHTGGVPGPRKDQGTIETVVFDVWLRTKKWPRSRVLYKQILAVFVTGSGSKLDWQMGTLRVVESLLWRPLQPIGANDDAFTFTCGFMLQLYPGSP